MAGSFPGYFPGVSLPSSVVLSAPPCLHCLTLSVAAWSISTYSGVGSTDRFLVSIAPVVGSTSQHNNMDLTLGATSSGQVVEGDGTTEFHLPFFL